MNKDNPFDKNYPSTGQPTKITISPSDTKPVTCPCGGEVFSQGVLLRKISPLLGGDDLPKPLGPIWYCVKCSKPAVELLPPELQPPIDV